MQDSKQCQLKDLVHTNTEFEDGATNNTSIMNENKLQAQEDLIIFHFFFWVGISRS